MARHARQCPVCGDTLGTGETRCRFCGEAVPGSLTLGQMVKDDGYQPDRFDLGKLRWPHRVMLVVIVLGVLIGFVVLDDWRSLAAFKDVDSVAIVGMLVAVGVLLGVPTGLFYLIQWLRTHKSRMNNDDDQS